MGGGLTASFQMMVSASSFHGLAMMMAVINRAMAGLSLVPSNHKMALFYSFVAEMKRRFKPKW